MKQLLWERRQVGPRKSTNDAQMKKEKGKKKTSGREGGKSNAQLGTHEKISSPPLGAINTRCENNTGPRRITRDDKTPWGSEVGGKKGKKKTC